MYTIYDLKPGAKIYVSHIGWLTIKKLALEEDIVFFEEIGPGGKIGMGIFLHY